MATVTQTSTSLGSVTSAAAGTAASVPTGTRGGRGYPLVLVVSTGVTTGATIVVQGRNDGPGPSGGNSAYREIGNFVVSANGSKAIPLAAYMDVTKWPDQIRVSAAVADGGAWTDGTHVCSLLTHA